MSLDVINKFVLRLFDYIEQNNLSEYTIVYHGGEPLLFGADRICEVTQIIRNKIPASCNLDFSIQTNGTLLTQESITKLNDSDIRISLSIDGPKSVNDLHRLTIINESSYEETLSALKLLSIQSSNVFAGVIAVIDPIVNPEILFEFFNSHNIPQLDLLLPDSTYLRPPPGKDRDPEIFQKWLQNAFTLWYNKYSNIPIRWFDSILSSRLGLPSSSDAMGFGNINLIVIDTDGKYSDHDVFKITNSNRASLQESVFSKSFKEVEEHAYLKEHSEIITFEGLSKECRNCPAVETCGGGSVMHRFHPTRGFDMPTVYCNEFYSLISHATKLMEISLNSDTISEDSLIIFPNNHKDFLDKCISWKDQIENIAHNILSNQSSNELDSDVAVLINSYFKKNITSKSTFLKKISIATNTTWLGSIKIQNNVYNLAYPFIEDMNVIIPNSEKIYQGISLLEKASKFLSFYDPNILKSISILISDIVFVEEKDKNGKNIFSFSDDKAPNVIFVSPFVNDDPITPEDLADSIFHEFLHHVLYHTEKEGDLLINHIYPRFPAPWKNELRPSGGFLHGTFVFTFLSKYWLSLLKSKNSEIPIDKIKINIEMYIQYSIYGVNTLKEFGLLTKRGIIFINQLEIEVQKNIKEFSSFVNN